MRYEEPSIEFVRLIVQDVIVLSPGEGEGEEIDPNVNNLI